MISEQDIFFIQVIPIYIAVLIELKKVGDLFYLAHKLVRSNPNMAESWFAAGSYYYLVQKYDLARKYFEKAFKIDR